MNKPYPWEKISKPSSEINRLRADTNHPHDFFWGKDSEGHQLLVIVFCSEHLKIFTPKDILLSGIRTDIRKVPETDEAIFLLCLMNNENEDIFYSLCMDLLEKTRSIPNVLIAIEVLHNRLLEWSDFLSKTNKKHLTNQQIQGLFAELCFLKELIVDNEYSKESLLSSWQGPERNAHDFILGDIAVEIKSVAGSHAESVRISSENQLSTYLEHLFLKCYFLSVDQDGEKGISLNYQVSKVLELLDHQELIEIFEKKLIAAGYINLSEYDCPSFGIEKEQTYQVRDDFPRITPATLPQGITKVSYDLELIAISDYKIDAIPKRRQ